MRAICTVCVRAVLFLLSYCYSPPLHTTTPLRAAIEFVAGQPTEFFNFLEDPFELHNAIDSLSSGTVAALSTHLAAAVACKGMQCDAVLSSLAQ